ncbi:MAG: type II secretion system F family protein [Patescibacteria group bacterium]|nr:type II secretion system F family protein [Patescibacteria group bacterium]
MTFGLSKERDYFIENLSMLIASGMPITSALDAMALEMRSRRMKSIVADIKADIESGSPLWKALVTTNLFPDHAVSLIQLGEESGKLMENLKVVAVEQEKDRVFKSKLRSAMMYPVFVLSLTVIIGVGIAWFILPKLATVFSQLKIKLPLITKILIESGIFLGNYGQYVVPAGIVVMGLFFFFLFSFRKTKFIGQFVLFSSPGIKGLIKEVEVARFGYLLGTLLEAGLPITHVFNSLANATEVAPYRKLYFHLRDSIKDGNSLQKSFGTFRHANRLIPAPIQQLIFVGEQSGSLSTTSLKIGATFETKADTSTKNLAVILEPILLVIVWLGVVAVALAVILPIYNLIGGFNAGGQQTPQTEEPSVSVVVEDPTVDLELKVQEVLPSAETIDQGLEIQEVVPGEEVVKENENTLRILPTGFDYLNVRDASSVGGNIITHVAPGDVYVYTEESEGWYRIVLSDGESGWVSGKYIETIGN